MAGDKDSSTGNDEYALQSPICQPRMMLSETHPATSGQGTKRIQTLRHDGAVFSSVWLLTPEAYILTQMVVGSEKSSPRLTSHTKNFPGNSFLPFISRHPKAGAHLQFLDTPFTLFLYPIVSRVRLRQRNDGPQEQQEVW